MEGTGTSIRCIQSTKCGFNYIFSVGSTTSLKRNSEDIGWEFGELAFKDDSDKVKCKLCGSVVTGGVHRLKEHIAQVRGNVAACPKATPTDKAMCLQALEEFKKRKEEKKEKLRELQDRVNISERSMIDVEILEAVDQFGPGYKPPTQYQLKEPLLKQAVETTKVTIKKQEEEWKKNGCSIMTDAWSDRKRRSIMNLCVNCKLGTTFLSSIEASAEAHTGQYIFDYVDKWIEEVGSKNVVQVVTDNASNNMAAAKLLKDKRPHIFWTSCATHTLNLILEGICMLFPATD